ncbi:urease accessory protein UreF [Spiribacter halobius]|uniref:Urease accessory protein UreF n=2 Tax=Sediminicurvatus halobius TaxID=2182432 RepID=A0A2U2N9T4_9GAMM|nr:urease accessory UreF family protein [Spiribacter halobius]PWG65878.1 urease accessory protein UreF [Spiribacter halobius]UEX79931.1 urease accessory protein UreF [Spiribacter halobius]
MAELRLWQLVSPSLPVGAYAYSAGLETAVEQGWVTDAEGLAAWTGGQIRHALAGLDVPVLLRLHRAWAADEPAAVAAWTLRLLAARETAELRAEDRHLGRALARLLADLGEPRAAAFDVDGDVTWATAFALAAVGWQVSAWAAARAYLWAWLESQVAAGVKIIPLGQTAGQRVLRDVAAEMPAAVAHAATLPDDDLGATAPGVSLASSWHETQYTRLFRS